MTSNMTMKQASSEHWIQYGSDLYTLGADEASFITARKVGDALGKLNRYAGHTTIPYSVAQHSMHVAWMLWETQRDALLAMHGLLHDAGETVVGDIPGPVKHILSENAKQEILAIEEAAQKAIYRALGVPWPIDPKYCNLIKACDIIAFETERRDMLPACSQPWTSIGEPDDRSLRALSWNQAADEWVEAFKFYKERIHDL